MSGEPKVSALMVTAFAESRRAFLVRSLESYCRQTYANRELVVVTDGDLGAREALAAILRGLGRTDIELVAVEGTRTLGALRNVSLGRARGDVVCQWDDDDLYHPARIEEQVQPLRDGRAEACVLRSHVSYFPEDGRVVVVDWGTSLHKAHPGTLTMKRDLGVRYADHGPFSTRSEDSLVFHQLRRRRVPVFVLEGAPHLFVYRFHGGNTWAREHHEGMVSRYGASRTALLAAQGALSSALRDVLLEAQEVRVDGADGTAFSIDLAAARRCA
jgi:glycosyltransferase involved in cell wall biosynthesis